MVQKVTNVISHFTFEIGVKKSFDSHPFSRLAISKDVVIHYSKEYAQYNKKTRINTWKSNRPTLKNSRLDFGWPDLLRSVAVHLQQKRKLMKVLSRCRMFQRDQVVIYKRETKKWLCVIRTRALLVRKLLSTTRALEARQHKNFLVCRCP